MMKCSPLAWISSARCHLNLLDKVQRKAEHLIIGARQLHPHLQPGRQRQQQQQQQQMREEGPLLRDTLEYRRKVVAMTVHHKAQVQHVTHLSVLTAS